jgi:hypothetical protein
LIPNFVKMNLSKRKRTHTDTWTYAPPALWCDKSFFFKKGQ